MRMLINMSRVDNNPQINSGTFLSRIYGLHPLIRLSLKLLVHDMAAVRLVSFSYMYAINENE